MAPTGTGDGSGGKVDAVTFLTQHVTRPLVTVLLVATLCYGFIFGKTTAEAFQNVVLVVVTFWFARGGEQSRSSDRPPTEGGATASVPSSGGSASVSVSTTQPEKDKEGA